MRLVLIGSVYIGFAVADGRPKVIVAESSVASIFVVVAAVAVTGSVWLIVVDWVAAAIIAIAIVAGVDFG
jgi:hypothetical protein